MAKCTQPSPPGPHLRTISPPIVPPPQHVRWPPARLKFHLRALSSPAPCSSTPEVTFWGLTVPRRVLQHLKGHVFVPHRAPSRARRFLDSGYASARNDKGTLTAPGVHYTAPPDALSRPFRSRCPHPSTTRRTSLLSFRTSEPLVISTERQRVEKSTFRTRLCK